VKNGDIRLNINFFKEFSYDKIFSYEPLKNHTTFKIGGNADIFFKPSTIDELVNCINICKNNDIKYYIMGNGSNIIFSDNGFRGVVIKTTSLNEIKQDEKDSSIFYIGSGADMRSVSNYFLEKEYTGFEFACGIPGSFGGGIYMNAGAYGTEMKDIVLDVDILQNDSIINLKNIDMKFAYRYSIVKNTNMVILGARIKLEKGIYKDIKNKIDDLTYRRESKQPLEYPSAGSVFKRPPDNFAGKLIQESGLCGYSIGGAMVSQKHAGFIINLGNATAKNVLDLIEYIKQTVKQKFDVDLHEELVFIGE